MGGAWLLLSDGRLPDAALAALVQRELDAVEAAMSPWRSESELNRVSAAPWDEPVAISAPLAHVLNFALYLQDISGGAFDPSMGGEVSQAGFGPARRPIARGAVRLNKQVLTRSAPVTLDLCAVAKGYGVDRVATALRQSGVMNFLLNVSGDLLAHGCAPDGTPWRVAVELPVPDRQVIFRKIPLNGALATSGTYRNRRGRVSHLMDGTKSAPVDHGLISVTVQAETAMQADGWATTLAILGPERGPALARQYCVSSIFVHEGADGFISRDIAPGW